jgi:hypothetical protein
MFIIDTVNFEFEREIDIDAQVEGSVNVGGVIYVTYGQNLGYFNGDGITFLRKLGPNSNPTYTHNLANKEGVLLVRDESAVLAYGNLGKGNVFWYPYKAAASNIISSIYYYGNNKVLTSSSGQKLDYLDFSLVSGAASWDSNFYSFPGKVWIRKIEPEMDTMASGSDLTFYSLDQNNNATQQLTMTYAADGAIAEKTRMCNILTSLFKLRVTFAAGNTKGLRKVTVFYEDAE